MAVNGLTQFYEELHQIKDESQEARQTPVFQCLTVLKSKLVTMEMDINQTSIRSINQAAFVNIETLLTVMELTLGAAMNCDKTEEIISSFTDKLNDAVLEDLMQITQEVLQKYGKKDEDGDQTVTGNIPNEQSDFMENTGYSNSNQKNSGMLVMSSQQQEKIIDDDGPVLDMTRSFAVGDGYNDELNHSALSATKMKKQPERYHQKTPGSNNKNRSVMDISIDNEYLEKIDAMENQNKVFQIELDRLRTEKEQQE